MAIKAAIIGMGGMGRVHLNGLRQVDDVELVGVCDVVGERLESAEVEINIETDAGAADLSGVHKYNDYRELLADESPDAVLICTPTYLHSEMTVAAMEAGAHVFCEKPVALSSAQAAESLAAAERTGKILQIGQVMRFFGEWRAIKEMIDARTYGPARSASFVRVCGLPGWSEDAWFGDVTKSGGGAMDLHIHDTDAIRWFFGPPDGIFARGITSADGGVSYIASQFLYDRGGPEMVLGEGGWVDPQHGFFCTLRVNFAEALVVFDTRQKDKLTIYHAAGDEKLVPEIPDTGTYTAELDYFFDCIRSGRACELVPPSEAAAAVRLVEAEIESVRTGEIVRVTE